MKQASYRRSRTACLLLLILFLLSVLDKNPEIPSADEIPYLGYTQTTSVPCILEEDTGIIPDFINAEENFYASHAVVLSRSYLSRSSRLLRILHPADAHVLLSGSSLSVQPPVYHPIYP